MIELGTCGCCDGPVALCDNVGASYAIAGYAPGMFNCRGNLCDPCRNPATGGTFLNCYNTLPNPWPAWGGGGLYQTENTLADCYFTTVGTQVGTGIVGSGDQICQGTALGRVILQVGDFHPFTVAGDISFSVYCVNNNTEHLLWRGYKNDAVLDPVGTYARDSGLSTTPTMLEIELEAP